MALKILQVFRTLYDVVSYEDENGQTRIKSMAGDEAVDALEKQNIVSQVETAYKIKFEQK